MESRVLLAFAGKMCTGKDTASEIWIKHYSRAIANKDIHRGYQVIAFANILKWVCMNLFGLSRDDVYTQAGKKKVVPLVNKTVRELLQGIGEGLRQYVDKDIWVTLTLREIDKLLATHTNILVTDVRYPNELAALKSRGFTTIKMVRNTGIQDTHPSEQDLDNSLFDYVIDNNDSLIALERKLLVLPEYHFTNMDGRA